MKRKNELFFVSLVLIAAFGVLVMGSVEPVSASCGVPCVPSVSCSCGSEVICEARLSLPTSTQACHGTDVSIPLSIDEFSPWLLSAYNISAESDLRNAYTAAVTFFLFCDPGDTLTVNDLIENGYNATEGVNLEIIYGTESDFEMDAYHACGDKIYTVEINGPPFTERTTPGFDGIESIEIDVEFNATVLAPADATLTGILANSGYTIDTDGATNGVVTVTITDTQSAQSTVNGVFAYLNFNVLGNEGDTTNLTFTQSLINDAPVGTITGLFEVNCITSPVLSVTPVFHNVSETSGTIIFNVANAGTGLMNWTAEANDSWLTIDNGASGTDSGTITVSYEANSGEPRTGTITVTAPGAENSPQTVEVRQTNAEPGVNCEARLSLPTDAQECSGADVSIPLSIDEFSPWIVDAYNISAESDLRNAYTAAVVYFLFDDPGGTITIAGLVDNGYIATEGVNIEIINGAESDFEMEAYHTCGDKAYSTDINGPPFTERSAPGFGGIESIEIDVEFNAAVLAPTDATLTGILANNGYTIDTDGATNGVVTVTIADTQNAQSTVNGVIAYLNFNVLGNGGDTTNLAFTVARINDTPVGTIAGLFEVAGSCGDPSVSLVVDFGPSWGLFGYDENDLWTPLNSNDPDDMVTADIDGDGQDELVVTFAGMGLYIWEGTGWSRINDVPEKMIEFNSGLMLDFGSEWGLFRYNEANGWTPLNNNDPYDMVAADIDGNGQDELAVSFVSDTPEIEGLYIWNNGWSKINNTVPEKMIEFNGGLILDFASLGLFGYENDRVQSF
ncbi:MAG: hypothetical protein GY795_13370 [Desulfobacterales bacterium]|nr:hypothetical protein [Desulfobacterales bacterium]